MSVVMGLGDNDDLYDWFIPEEKRPDLPLQKAIGTLTTCLQLITLLQDLETFPLGACVDYTYTKISKESQNGIALSKIVKNTNL